MQKVKLKNWLLIMIGCLLLVVSIFIYNISHADSQTNKSTDQINKVGQLWADNVSQNERAFNNTSVIAKVSGEPVLYKDFVMRKVMMETKAQIKNLPQPNNQDVFDAVVNDKITALLAKKYGVYPTEDEVKSYINQIRNSVSQSDNPGIITFFTNNLGITEDQYWNKWAVPLYTQDLINIKLGEVLAEKVTQKAGESKADYEKRVKENYTEVKESASKNVKIEIINTSLGIESF